MSRADNHLLDFYHSAFASTLDLVLICLGGAERLHDYHATVIEEIADAPKRRNAVPRIETRRSTHADLARIHISWMTAYWSGVYEATCQGQVDLLLDSHARAREFAADLTQVAETAPDETMAAMKLVVADARLNTADTAPAARETVRIAIARVAAVKTQAGASPSSGGARCAA